MPSNLDTLRAAAFLVKLAKDGKPGFFRKVFGARPTQARPATAPGFMSGKVTTPVRRRPVAPAPAAPPVMQAPAPARKRNFRPEPEEEEAPSPPPASAAPTADVMRSMRSMAAPVGKGPPLQTADIRDLGTVTL